ncbi:MAG: hypothetical protein ABSC22_16350 [Roseiarcus sp.]|jgi:hypothetical protein
MNAFEAAEAAALKSKRGDLRWSALFAPWLLLASVAALAQPAQPVSVVEPTGNLKPQYSKAQTPSPQQLIETWRSFNQNMTDKKVDTEQFQIIAYRVATGKIPRAFLQFQIFSSQADPLAWAAQRCPGRTRPVEIQVYYQWSDDLGAWVPQGGRGENDDNLCSDQTLWTSDQIEQVVNPKPLPTPPKISRADVSTPPAGSPVRAAIMDALRPRYESLFGAPIVFKVETLRVAAGFAFVVVHPERPNGAPIDQKTWTKALTEQCFQYPASVEHEYWMKLDGGVWKVGVKNDMCADDSISQEGDLIGAPPQLAGLDQWPEREFMPLPE